MPRTTSISTTVNALLPLPVFRERVGERVHLDFGIPDFNFEEPSPQPSPCVQGEGAMPRYSNADLHELLPLLLFFPS
jgi:hypothetical protein